MKQILFLAVTITFCSFSGCEEEESLITLPNSITNYITTNYSTYTIEESELEITCDSTDVYEVELEDGRDEVEFVFDMEGNLLYSETEIKDSDLPTAVSSSITTNFANYISDNEAYQMNMADGSIQYEVELENGTAELEVIFAADGTVLCQRIED
jgi:uncharacterized membrane protein YkoI